MVGSRISVLLLLLLIASTAIVQAQTRLRRDNANPYYSRKNSFGIFGEYSNDSSHILLGQAPNRKLLNFGVAYSRRLLLRAAVDMQYQLELRPVILESDPRVHVVDQYAGPPANRTDTGNFAQVEPCHARTSTFTGVYKGGPYNGDPFTFVDTVTCTRQWTFGQGFSPVGFKFNFRPRHRLQPVLSGAGGYLFATKAIPTEAAGGFNFTFEVGAGFELYRSREHATGRFGNRSIRAEYRYHHISNAYTANTNPGIDNGMLQITYAFGR